MNLSFSFVDAKILLQELTAGGILESTRIGKIPTNLGKFPQRLLHLIPEDRPMSHGPGPIRSGTGSACTGTSVLPEATMVSAQFPVSEWLQRIRGEYEEMPGLSLTKSRCRSCGDWTRSSATHWWTPSWPPRFSDGRRAGPTLSTARECDTPSRHEVAFINAEPCDVAARSGSAAYGASVRTQFSDRSCVVPCDTTPDTGRRFMAASLLAEGPGEVSASRQRRLPESQSRCLSGTRCCSQVRTLRCTS